MQYRGSQVQSQHRIILKNHHLKKPSYSLIPYTQSTQVIFTPPKNVAPKKLFNRYSSHLLFFDDSHRPPVSLPYIKMRQRGRGSTFHCADVELWYKTRPRRVTSETKAYVQQRILFRYFTGLDTSR